MNVDDYLNAHVPSYPKPSLDVTLFCDTSDSFLHDYITEFKCEIGKRSHKTCFITDANELEKGDVLFLLGCKHILSKEELLLHDHNLVIHPSKLPHGRGCAALVWDVLNGCNEVWVTLFEADEQVDHGPVYYQEKICLTGYELCDKIRYLQAMKIKELMLRWLDDWPDVHPVPQNGIPSFYPVRKPVDSMLDVDKSIRDQFNLLRVVDNRRYPAFFVLDDHRYVVHVLEDDC